MLWIRWEFLVSSSPVQLLFTCAPLSADGSFALSTGLALSNRSRRLSSGFQRHGSAPTSRSLRRTARVRFLNRTHDHIQSMNVCSSDVRNVLTVTNSKIQIFSSLCLFLIRGSFPLPRFIDLLL